MQISKMPITNIKNVFASNIFGSGNMEKLKQCASCRYCRVQTFVTLSAALLIGAVATIVMVFDGRL